MESWFSRSHQKDRPIQSPPSIHKEVWKIFSNPDLTGVSYQLIERSLQIYFGCTFSSLPDLDRGFMVGVAGRQWMFTCPRHLI
jgi:hypothetical protein